MSDAVLPSLSAAWDVAWPLAMAAGAATVVASRRVVEYLKRRRIMDHPNERSSHKQPTPRGGGLATTPVMAALLLLLLYRLPGLHGALALGALVLFAVSWIDDRKGLPALPRFLAHGVVIAASLALVPADMLVFQGVVPLWADRVVAGLGWLWFVNLYNFMDGIDGITGIETASLGGGIALAAALSASFDLMAPALIVAAIGAGFLAVNWHPARVFLGDSGSIPFGFVLGGLLVMLAADGKLAAALILPAYYLADATITLGRRALRGEKVWQAHRQHFYQRAVQGGARHDQVALAVLAGNLLLIAAAALAVSGQVWAGAVSALAVVAAMLGIFQRWSTGKPA